MERFLEQRYAIKFCVELGKTSQVTPDMIKEAYGDAAMAQCGNAALSPLQPDLAQPDFFLFPRIKSTLKGKHHGLVDVVQQALTSELNSIPVQAFLEAYENWKTRLHQCIDAEGCYFEKF
ncbi:uncharacterized protein TNCV_1431511 [Trichonephila clavipes]|nr:uncharacterized protein TNCV_1431511 [Trichonephila clavipes]